LPLSGEFHGVIIT